MTQDVPNERADYDDQDTPEQQARCRALELAVILRALIDATWNGDEGVDLKTLTREQRRVMRLHRIRRLGARRWFLAPDPEQRAHVDDVAACAGLPNGMIWRLVQRFIVDREDPARLVRLNELMGERPGGRGLDLSVAFVA